MFINISQNLYIKHYFLMKNISSIHLDGSSIISAKVDYNIR